MNCSIFHEYLYLHIFSLVFFSLRTSILKSQTIKRNNGTRSMKVNITVTTILIFLGKYFFDLEKKLFFKGISLEKLICLNKKKAYILFSTLTHAFLSRF